MNLSAVPTSGLISEYDEVHVLRNDELAARHTAIYDELDRRANAGDQEARRWF